MAKVNRIVYILLFFAGLINLDGFSVTRASDTESAAAVESTTVTVQAWLPYATRMYASQPVQPPLLIDTRRVNVPFFTSEVKFSETAIFWLGKITPTENYADVRVGYTPTELYIRVGVFDRLLWYDSTPLAEELSDWDAVSVYLDKSGTRPANVMSSSYRFVAALHSWEPDRSPWQAAFQGNGSAWQEAALSFTTTAGIRWESGSVGGLNNYQNNRGYVVVFRIPFSSLGLSGAPAQGSLWSLGLRVHDREDSAGSPVADKMWPEPMAETQPNSWGELHFGLATFQSPAVTPAGSVAIRHGESGVVVQDAAVGGTVGNLCPGDPAYIWSGWAEDSYPIAEQINIQNQADLADWPCFSKYYLTIPLNLVPQGKVILDANLTVNLFGGSDPTEAEASLIQVFSIGEDWDPLGLTWNNAPLAVENLSRTWVFPTTFPGWPGIPYTWDVSRAAAQAYARGEPLRIALYSADGAIHSGKYFYASEADVAGRPTLTVTWGNP